MPRLTGRNTRKVLLQVPVWLRLRKAMMYWTMRLEFSVVCPCVRETISGGGSPNVPAPGLLDLVHCLHLRPVLAWHQRRVARHHAFRGWAGSDTRLQPRRYVRQPTHAQARLSSLSRPPPSTSRIGPNRTGFGLRR